MKKFYSMPMQFISVKLTKKFIFTKTGPLIVVDLLRLTDSLKGSIFTRHLIGHCIPSTVSCHYSRITRSVLRVSSNVIFPLSPVMLNKVKHPVFRRLNRILRLAAPDSG
ncbi:MAG: hypothetical protein HGB01_04150 [Chlorobiaceae bacterium]|nr:hypothetical protein [Chlorobiaceae bacterium]